ncbi:PLP-dependent aminotransferase family protein [Pseudoroseomonas wenyumeiae]
MAPPQGGAAVREHVCQRLAMRGIAVPPDGVLMTAGGTQALQLVAQAFLSPGDTVLVEDPGYFMLFPMLEQRGLRLVPVERRPDGPCLEALEQACRREAPKAFFLQPVLHNPTGWTASAANLHRLLRIAERHNLLLVEDDAHGDLHGGEPVRLMQLDGGASVIHVGSFTKLIGQGTRVGFLAASAERVQALLRTKITTALTGSGVEEQLVLEMLCSGQYRRHLETLRARLSAARGLVAGGCAGSASPWRVGRTGCSSGSRRRRKRGATLFSPRATMGWCWRAAHCSAPAGSPVAISASTSGAARTRASWNCWTACCRRTEMTGRPSRHAMMVVLAGGAIMSVAMGTRQSFGLYLEPLAGGYGHSLA